MGAASVLGGCGLPIWSTHKINGNVTTKSEVSVTAAVDVGTDAAKVCAPLAPKDGDQGYYRQQSAERYQECIRDYMAAMEEVAAEIKVEFGHPICDRCQGPAAPGSTEIEQRKHAVERENL
jgi:hypothetical protein